MNIPETADSIVPCSRCLREPLYCVCELIRELSCRTKLLILQHPREPGVDIGTVPILTGSFPRAITRTGLSWPNFTKALGYQADNKRWGVLYLGSVHVENLPPDRDLFVVNTKGLPIEEQSSTLKNLEGIVVLDGTWSQAKTLWWRNPWLLKLHRLVLRPSRRSLYDAIRKEPRKGCLSTVETVGEVISILEKRDDILPALDVPLSGLVARLRTRRSQRPRGNARRDWRRRSRR